ncbi:hypothetical protein ABIF78_003256 [Bradyrhizobium japonicum]
MFEPENSLEALMQAAARDASVVPAFYRALLETEIYILTPGAPMKPGRRRSLKFQEEINVATVDFQDMRWHPTFISKKRIYDYLKQPEVCLGAPPRAICSKCCLTLISGSIRCPNVRSRCPPPRSLSS